MTTAPHGDGPEGRRYDAAPGGGGEVKRVAGGRTACSGGGGRGVTSLPLRHLSIALSSFISARSLSNIRNSSAAGAPPHHVRRGASPPPIAGFHRGCCSTCAAPIDGNGNSHPELCRSCANPAPMGAQGTQTVTLP